MLPILGAYIPALVKIDYFSRYLHGVMRSVEPRNVPDSTDTVACRFPEDFTAHTVRADCSNSRNHNSALHLSFESKRWDTVLV